jgi:hypothetical protein
VYKKSPSYPLKVPHHTEFQDLVLSDDSVNPVEDTNHGQALINVINLRFEILMAVTMKSPVYWDDTPCSLVEVY